MKKKSIRKHKLKTKKEIGFGKWIITAIVLCVLCGILSLLIPKQLPCANSGSCISDLSGKVSNQTQGVFEGKRVTAPNESYFIKSTSVLGATTIATGKKHIYVDLSTQYLYAWQGNSLLFTFPISSGKYNLTPIGTFAIWIKVQATKMVGGTGATYYDLPNVPWTMYLYNANLLKKWGYALHGAYWHNNFGHPMSQGCINIDLSDAKLLYNWADPQTEGFKTLATPNDPGTLVTIYGKTPNSDLVGTPYYNNNTSPDEGDQIE